MKPTPSTTKPTFSITKPQTSSTTLAIQKPTQTVIEWVKDNPETVSSAADIMLLLTTISLIVTRNSLGRVKEHLKSLVSQLKSPNKSADYTLDSTIELKQSVYFWLNKLLNETTASWVTLGILSNGEVSQWGYHYSRLSWDFKVHSPEHEIPIGPLDNINATQLSVDLFNLYCDTDSPRLIKQLHGYHTEFYAVKYGNLLVAAVAVGYLDSRPDPIQDDIEKACNTIIQLVQVLGQLIKSP